MGTGYHAGGLHSCPAPTQASNYPSYIKFLSLRPTPCMPSPTSTTPPTLFSAPSLPSVAGSLLSILIFRVFAPDAGESSSLLQHCLCLSFTDLVIYTALIEIVCRCLFMATDCWREIVCPAGGGEDLRAGEDRGGGEEGT